MSEQTDIENWAKEQFSELENYGFTKPVISRDRWTTSIDWLRSDIAIEIELAWREFDAFVFVVRLENHQLPDGYYVSNGKRCRHYLQRIIRDRGWSVPPDAMKVLNPSRKRRRRPTPNADSLKKRLLDLKAVLIHCIDEVVANGASIFSD